jgi:hypothetical protein
VCRPETHQPGRVEVEHFLLRQGKCPAFAHSKSVTLCKLGRSAAHSALRWEWVRSFPHLAPSVHLPLSLPQQYSGQISSCQVHSSVNFDKHTVWPPFWTLHMLWTAHSPLLASGCLSSSAKWYVMSS